MAQVIPLRGTVLDLGSDLGYLVGKLLDRGIDTIAVDSSSESIAALENRFGGHPHFFLWCRIVAEVGMRRSFEGSAGERRRRVRDDDGAGVLFIASHENGGMQGGVVIVARFLRKQSAFTTDARVGMERRILIVEDEPAVLQLLCDVLEMEGYECRGLDHPELVSDMVVRWRPDVIVLDLMLPRRSGIEVAEELRSQGFSRTQLIALSAAGIMQDLAWQSDLFTAVLRKPFDLHTLTHAVEEAISQIGAASPWRAEDSTVVS